MEGGSNHPRVRAATGPDGDAVDLILDTPEIWLGLASLCLAVAAGASGTNFGSSAFSWRTCRRHLGCDPALLGVDRPAEILPISAALARLNFRTRIRLDVMVLKALSPAGSVI
jgi:hypothetical protein